MDDDGIFTIEGCLSGVRLLGLETFLRKCALLSGVDLTITRVHKGLLRKTVSFEASGTRDELDDFHELLSALATRTTVLEG